MIAKEDQDDIVVLKWRDTRDVRILSTKQAPIMAPVRSIHSHQSTPTQPSTSSQDSAQQPSTSAQPTTTTQQGVQLGGCLDGMPSPFAIPY